MRLRLGKVTVADVLAAQPVTTNLLKFMRASIKMIGVSNLQSFIASMTQKLTLSDISDESKNYLDKAGITTNSHITGSFKRLTFSINRPQPTRTRKSVLRVANCDGHTVTIRPRILQAI